MARLSSSTAAANRKRPLRAPSAAPPAKKQKTSTKAKTWYSARAILDADASRFLIDWDGADEGGRAWEPSWEPRRNANGALVREWRERKAAGEPVEKEKAWADPGVPVGEKKRGRGRPRKKVVEEPAVEEEAKEPVVEEPAKEPAVEEPAVEEPAVEEPAAEEPAIEEPAVEEPIVEEPSAEEPAVQEKAKAGKKGRGKKAAAKEPATNADPDPEVYSARAIVRERKYTYLVSWEPNATTGEEYEDTWEPKDNVSQGLRDVWMEVKKAKLREDVGKSMAAMDKREEKQQEVRKQRKQRLAEQKAQEQPLSGPSTAPAQPSTPHVADEEEEEEEEEEETAPDVATPSVVVGQALPVQNDGDLEVPDSEKKETIIMRAVQMMQSSMERASPFWSPTSRPRHKAVSQYGSKKNRPLELQ